jgi:hypothetical protein
LRELVDALTPERLSRLSHAPRTQRLLEAEQDARRARLANLNRFREDIAWRFGHASVATSDQMPRTPLRRLKAYASDSAKSGQQRASGDVAVTARTAS